MQAFFARLIEHNDLRLADPARGRFRSLLLSSLAHFLSNEHRRQAALKRGGGQTVLSLDFAEGESRYALEPADHLTPEKVFERRWATTLLDRVLGRLQASYAAAGKQPLYEALREHLAGDSDRLPHRALAERLGMSESAVKVAVHRLRRRCGELLREEIAQTVATPEEVDDELRQLFAAVSN